MSDHLTFVLDLDQVLKHRFSLLMWTIINYKYNYIFTKPITIYPFQLPIPKPITSETSKY